MKKSFFKWSWVFLVIFFIVSVYDFRFAILGFICMLSPIVLSLLGYKKMNCNSICPRGSFLQNFMTKISKSGDIPKFMLTNKFKIGVVLVVFTIFGINMYNAGGDLNIIGFAVFRMVFATTVLAIIMGYFFNPRTWCAVCPMGYISGEIAKKR